MIPEASLNRLIASAYAEDVGTGDHSSLCCIDSSVNGRAHLLVKQDGIIAGVDVAKHVCRYFSDQLMLTDFIADGEAVHCGDIVLELSGRQVDILTVERTLLNFMQLMSGIATETHRYAAVVEDLKTKVLDTRKTAPGLRLIEKEAVRIGGGVNHRMGLYDMIMLKDNHIDFAGGIGKAIHRAVAYNREHGLHLPIEIETRNLDEVRQVLQVGDVQRIMLDNFDLATTREAVQLIAGRYEAESSGGITIDNLRDYALCGVDFISVGALTHHVGSLDLSLKAV